LRILLIAAAAGVISFVLTAVVASMAAEWHRVPAMEGGSAVTAILWAMLGAVVGAGLAAWFSRNAADGAAAFRGGRQAMGVMVALVAVGAAVAYTAAGRMKPIRARP
jgi:hypothetical protein